jgi:trigger factor
MQVSVEAAEGLERTVKVVIPEEKIAGEVETRLKNMTRTTRLQGFRAGKVPYKIIRQRFGAQVRQEVVGEVMQSSFYEALTEKNLRPVGVPEIGSLDAELGKGLEYTAKFEVYPEIKIAALSTLKIEKPVCEVTGEDLDKMVEVLRKQHSKVGTVDRVATSEDLMDIDFEGFVDGKPFEGSAAKGVRMDLDAGRFIEGFEEGLIGKQAGDKFTLDLKFPEDFHGKDLAGKPVEFQITVNSVLESVPADLDEEFFKQFGVEEGGLQGFKDQVKQQMERDLESLLHNRLRDSVMDALVEANPVTLPRNLVEQEMSRIKQRVQKNLESQGLGSEELEKLSDDIAYETQARKNVAMQLVVAELIKSEDIKADPGKVKLKIEKLAESYHDPAAVIQWYYSDKNRLGEVEAMVLEDEVIEAVSSQAEVEDVKLTFDEVMNNRQTETV